MFCPEAPPVFGSSSLFYITFFEACFLRFSHVYLWSFDIFNTSSCCLGFLPHYHDHTVFEIFAAWGLYNLTPASVIFPLPLWDSSSRRLPSATSSRPWHLFFLSSCTICVNLLLLFLPLHLYLCMFSFFWTFCFEDMDRRLISCWLPMPLGGAKFPKVLLQSVKL